MRENSRTNLQVPITAAAAAAAKSLQSCPTLCSPPGSAVPGILQARILEWVAISFSREYVKSSRNIVYITFFYFFRLVNIFRLELVDQHRKEVVTKSDKQEQ